MLGSQDGVIRVSGPAIADLIPALWELFNDAFEGDFSTSDFENACGGQHFIRFERQRIVAHAAVVERLVSIDSSVLKIGYVEAVSVASSVQGSGLGSQIMIEVTDFCRKTYSIALLSSEETGFYERFGWERFTGESYSNTQSGIVRTQEDDGSLMFLSLEPSIRHARKLVALDRVRNPW